MKKVILGSDFDGETYDPVLDHATLTGQLLNVYNTMKSGLWYTLHDLSAATGGSEASVSARLRDLRKDKFGSFIVDRKRSQVHRGLWYYRLSGESK